MPHETQKSRKKGLFHEGCLSMYSCYPLLVRLPLSENFSSQCCLPVTQPLFFRLRSLSCVRSRCAPRSSASSSTKRDRKEPELCQLAQRASQRARSRAIGGGLAIGTLPPPPGGPARGGVGLGRSGVPFLCGCASALPGRHGGPQHCRGRLSSSGSHPVAGSACKEVSGDGGAQPGVTGAGGRVAGAGVGAARLRSIAGCRTAPVLAKLRNSSTEGVAAAAAQLRLRRRVRGCDSSCARNHVRTAQLPAKESNKREEAHHVARDMAEQAVRVEECALGRGHRMGAARHLNRLQEELRARRRRQKRRPMT